MNDTSSKYTGRVRWAVNFMKWDPTDDQWNFCLSLIEPEEKERILKPTASGYITGRFNPDAKSACIGRLLLRMLVHKELDIPYKEIKFSRTKEGKPYLVNSSNKFVNFNFNLSHHSEWVVIGSEPSKLIGVDVMDMRVPHKKEDSDVIKFFRDMESCFTPYEWKNIKSSESLDFQVSQFFRHWTLKEGYIKAVGIGLGFELQRAEFSLNSDATVATIRIDGKEQPQWQFQLHYLSGNVPHVVCVALGPSIEATQSYKATMNVVENSQETEYVPFSELCYEDLLPK